MSRVVIVGGGLAGSLAALALARRRPEVDLLLVEQGLAFGGTHTWSWFDTDVAPRDGWVLDPVKVTHWPSHDVRFPRRGRTIPIGYNSIRSPDLDRAVRATLASRQYRLGATVAELGPTHVALAGGERIDADAAIDARGPSPIEGLELGWQKFLGRIYSYDDGHGVARPVIMDATVEQLDGYRFVYLLPMDEHRLLIEDTYYSTSAAVDRPALASRLDAAARQIGAGSSAWADEESGVLPVVIRGSLDALWPAGDSVPKLGVRGGFFHPTTSYSLPDAVANAAFLAEQPDFSAAALAATLRRRAQRLWRQRRFFQLLDRMLFRAAEPAQSYRVLEHFYRLPPALIGRFYAARLSGVDKLRILSGKPPVPLGRAIAALIRKPA